jgi:hypothetical protein
VRVAEPKSKGASVGYACGEQWAVLRLHWRGVTPMRVARCVSCRSRGGDGDRGSGADDRAPHEREREREKEGSGCWHVAQKKRGSDRVDGNRGGFAGPTR